MNATLIVRTTGNETSITVKRTRAFRIYHIATSDLTRTLKRMIITLANLGYDVKVID